MADQDKWHWCSQGNSYERGLWWCITF